ncbi:hypothetical protein B296_00014140 [Ensete ventricosum]|uniref:TMEM205-like domain-containing protein n=1 Tax=Ensete ventricosum TaxID=4639 RepID=A0A427ADY9_ENSVE|nr:hypothetical protein B296_00014140 [Ensete ventricosum]
MHQPASIDSSRASPSDTYPRRRLLLPQPPTRNLNLRFLSLPLAFSPGAPMAWSTRFLTVVAFLAVGVVFAPDVLGSGPESPAAAVSAAKLCHLLAFATAWGAALWVTFIGGIIMFKYLPRHQFGNLQRKMFPAYFMVVSVCAAVSVAAFAYLHPWRSASSIERYQLGFLLSALGFDLSNLLVFTPMTIEVIHSTHPRS